MLCGCAGAECRRAETADGRRRVLPVGANCFERDVDDELERVAVRVDGCPRVIAPRDPVERVARDDEQPQPRGHACRGGIESVPAELQLEQDVVIDGRIGEQVRQRLVHPAARLAPTAFECGSAVRCVRCTLYVTDRELRDEVRRLRAAGMPPNHIARALGVRRAVISPLVRELAAETPPRPPEQGELVGCWVSPAWSRDLLVQRREGWEDVDLGPDGPAGIVLVLIARAGRRVTVCGYLIDTFCLGVKNTIGPQRMHKRDLPGFVRLYFAGFPGSPLRAPLSLAQHVVHGAVAFAAALGFDPHPDYALARAFLGELDEPCAITFGQRGRPLYVAGPHDDAIAVLRTLKASVGGDGFTVAA
jgi:hypothetical protein